jgi:hypothetical protein
VAFEIGFPAVFFLLSAAVAVQVETAFALAKWSGLGLIGLYGFSAGRLAGAGLPAALARAAAVAPDRGVLIVLKALIH